MCVTVSDNLGTVEIPNWQRATFLVTRYEHNSSHKLLRGAGPPIWSRVGTAQGNEWHAPNSPSRDMGKLAMASQIVMGRRQE
jgi:hypothetical protein